MTEAQIKALPAGGVLIKDGIEARRLKADTAYYSNLMLNRLRIRRLLGKRSEGFNLARAKDAIVQLKARAHDQDALIKLSGKTKKPMTFAQGADEYLTRSKATGGNNIAQKTQQLEDHLVPHFGEIKLGEMTSAEVDGYSTLRNAAGAAAGTINAELAVVKHMYSMLAEWDLVAPRKFKVRMQKVDNARTVVLSTTEIEALLEAAKHDQDPFTYLFVLIGVRTGMRHREILRLRFDQINFYTLRFYIPEAKAGARQQPFPKSIIPELKRHQGMQTDQNGWLFPSNSPSGHRDLMSKQFSRCVVAADMDRKLVTPHVMRHTVITKLVQGGTPLPVVMKISGHKSMKMLERYTHIGDQFVTDALDAVA